jgi:hypothetical protein
MDAINFGTLCWFQPCSGTGPWVTADLENGLFSGGNGSDPGNTGNSSSLVTAMLKNNGTTTYAIKDANAQSGALKTEYSGPLPDIGGYTPMHQEGSVLLGTGGDDSNGSAGDFFEGVIAAGYPSGSTDAAVPANVVVARSQQEADVPGERHRAHDHEREQRHERAAGELRHRQRHRHRAEHGGHRLPAVDLHQRGQRPLRHHERQQRHSPRLGELRVI